MCVNFFGRYGDDGFRPRGPGNDALMQQGGQAVGFAAAGGGGDDVDVGHGIFDAVEINGFGKSRVLSWSVTPADAGVQYNKIELDSFFYRQLSSVLR